MFEIFVRLMLHLYPPEFRARFGPEILADCDAPETNRLAALIDILRSGIMLRLTSPGPYIFIASTTLAAFVVTVSGAFTLRGAYRLLSPRIDAASHLYGLLFLAVFLVVTGVLVLAIHWLQTFRKMTAPCSKSRI